jgi:conjugal transfer/entry exclusion protein
VASLFGFDLSAVFNAVKSFLGPVGKLIDSLKTSITHLTNIVQNATKLLDGIIAEAKAWASFKQDVRIKSRVIALESAIAKTRTLIEGIPAAWRSIQDIFKTFKTQFDAGGDPIADADAVAEDLASAEEGGISALLKKFPKLAKGFEKILGILALVIQALEAISSVIDDLQQILDEITALRLEIEKLDTIFLSQSNKRKTLKLADGSSIQIRVGKLHPSA